MGEDKPEAPDASEEEQGEEEIASDRRPTVETPAVQAAMSPDRARTVETPTAHPRRPQGRPVEQGDKWKWWYYVLGGLLFIAFAVYEYIDLTKWEQEGGTRTMHSWLAAAYDLVGKWGVVGVLGDLGLLVLAVGAYSFLEKKPEAGTE